LAIVKLLPILRAAGVPEPRGNMYVEAHKLFHQLLNKSASKFVCVKKASMSATVNMHNKQKKLQALEQVMFPDIKYNIHQTCDLILNTFMIACVCFMIACVCVFTSCLSEG
jgi:hypothetical protein